MPSTFVKIRNYIEAELTSDFHEAETFFENTLTAVEPAAIAFFKTNGLPLITAAATALLGGTAPEAVIATALVGAKELAEKGAITVGAVALNQIAGELVGKASAQNAAAGNT